ncbi:MAG: calcium/sodium antiporter [Planctomycetes bacterium]|nr:calcium/sodium antiporter [Planctomycetota bacterium]
MEAILQVAGGLILLLLGAEILVRGAASLAIRMRISPATVGLTVVAIGTSLPELLISIRDRLDGTGAIAVGGVVGSNIFNIGAILGLAALIRPVTIPSRTLRAEYPFMLGATLVYGLVAADGRMTPLDGGLLLGLCLGFVLFLYLRVHRRRAPRLTEEAAQATAELEPVLRPLVVDLLYLVGGIVALHQGARIALIGGRGLAEAWGISQHMIGLTLVAFGTSAPELAVSTLAAYRGKSEIAVGNIVGSCIFNLALVLPVASFFGPFDLPERAAGQDFRWLLGISALMLPLMLRGRSLGRLDGAVLVAAFALYYGLLLAGR